MVECMAYAEAGIIYSFILKKKKHLTVRSFLFSISLVHNRELEIMMVLTSPLYHTPLLLLNPE